MNFPKVRFFSGIIQKLLPQQFYNDVKATAFDFLVKSICNFDGVPD